VFHTVRLITSKLVWDRHKSLIQLAKHNRVHLIWVSGHEGIVGNETADQLGLDEQKPQQNVVNP
jgi:ribonuclease HI